MNWIWVAVGSALGGSARYAVALWLPHQPGRWPVATFTVNVLGSFAIGCVFAWWSLRSAQAEGLRLFLMTGILGGFTTYSAFALEASLLDGAVPGLRAVGYAVATVVGCVGAALAGRRLFEVILVG
ncbi:MAG: CrcB family protein [Steroidobacteraceae bacterium]